ncbi:BT1926 family outer membrane beta-barrel protein [Bacteroides bouchesdurhonensis]|uniref:BT1926 family outer membrane beta-barrel protein n=1 Tax=Bacteroides bouchesdurhonensis TaxID=1841855 RepID=UPI0011DCEC6C|nr:BT1926 family outer membrane beta-barrel protein [Bacteroides bouchesdurhonensis]
MIKKLCTILLLAAFVAPTWAQRTGGDKEGVVFAPRKGQWQVSLVLGNSGQFYNENTSYLLPQYTNTEGSIGLPNGGTNNSGDLNHYLNISGLNNNSLVNIAGLQAKYFVDDCWDINLSLGMNISITPKKDYIEGDYKTTPDMIIPDQKYVNAQVTNNWYVTVGSNRYFKTSNPRIQPYLGAAVGFQMARIETTEPYTGKMYNDGEDDTEEGLPEQLYLAAGKAGQMFGIKGAAVAGLEYCIAKGLMIGVEFQPIAYRYDVIQICPKGFDKYNVGHHNIKLFDMPVVKLGFRF